MWRGSQLYYTTTIVKIKAKATKATKATATMRREGKVNNVRTSQTVKFCGCQTCARSGAHNRRRQGFGVNVCTCDDGKVKRGLKKSAMLVNLPQNCLQADQKVLMRKAKHRDFGDVY